MKICNRCSEDFLYCRCKDGPLEYVIVSSELRQNLEANPEFAKAFGQMIEAVKTSIRTVDISPAGGCGASGSEPNGAQSAEETKP